MSYTNDGKNLHDYLRKIHNIDNLESQEEANLIKEWRSGKKDALDSLINSHLKLVAKIASGYRGYGLDLEDLIAEGNLGVITAANKFEPERGVRFFSYATWWIKAAINSYILKNWSAAKIATNNNQRKLFFKLRSYLNNKKSLSDDDIKKVARELNVSEKDVDIMHRRFMGKDVSLNSKRNENDEGSWEEWIGEEESNPETLAIKKNEQKYNRALLNEAMMALNERERKIFLMRKIEDPPKTLEEVSLLLNISRERVRQIDNGVSLKVQQYIKEKILRKQ